MIKERILGKEGVEMLLDSPRYAFERDVTNPYFVIVHEDQIDLELNAGNLSFDLGNRVKSQIADIKSRNPNSWTRAGPRALAEGVPRGRPVLVCGAFENFCVAQQYDHLIRAGYDAYISREGTLHLDALNQ